MRSRRTYMMDVSSLVKINKIKDDQVKQRKLGIFLKSRSDIVNFAVRKLAEFLEDQ